MTTQLVEPVAVQRSRLAALLHGPWPLLVATASVGCLIALRPDRGDVEIYRQGGRAAVTTGAVFAYQQQGHGFTYPPFAALVMALLAWLPNWAMWAALVLGGIGALGVVLALSAPGIFAAARRRAGNSTLGLAALVVSEPVVTTLRFGQVDLLLAAIVMADVLVFRRGVLLGFATAMKLTPGLFVVYLLARRRYREARTAAATFAVSVLWGFLVLPRTSSTYWTHNLIAGTGVGSFTTVGNQSVHGVISRVLGAHLGTAVWLVLAVPILVGGLRLACRAAEAGLAVLAVGTVGVTGCLVSPVSWPHHWVWFLPLVCGLWRLRAGDLLLTRWLAVAAVFAVVSQFVPLKAVGIGYVPIAVVLLVLQRGRLAGRRSSASAVRPRDVHPGDTSRPHRQHPRSVHRNCS
ncbi:glycosyltransferase 87 family protein [uncultured Jatrophihabitans sp.]|uniref:glycosyltransferase 87 family protein n=1 Tax=uncultured Jatrophihabitans sp. TaxID=1610747 RepID=UPI0035CB470E